MSPEDWVGKIMQPYTGWFDPSGRLKVATIELCKAVAEEARNAALDEAIAVIRATQFKDAERLAEQVRALKHPEDEKE